MSTSTPFRELPGRGKIALPEWELKKDKDVVYFLKTIRGVPQHCFYDVSAESFSCCAQEGPVRSCGMLAMCLQLCFYLCDVTGGRGVVGYGYVGGLLVDSSVTCMLYSCIIPTVTTAALLYLYYALLHTGRSCSLDVFIVYALFVCFISAERSSDTCTCYLVSLVAFLSSVERRANVYIVHATTW